MTHIASVPSSGAFWAAADVPGGPANPGGTSHPVINAQCGKARTDTRGTHMTAETAADTAPNFHWTRKTFA